ncbi:glycosyltransferase [uncultured Clostridium sp.]|uniref:glycosyltransferase n=1 Tax=uncultured Clostridium sp. TaxID=59620 RepID=UPI0025CDD27D|nr:glycosyltransferase [uncultured Clostridium sp.]
MNTVFNLKRKEESVIDNSLIKLQSVILKKCIYKEDKLYLRILHGNAQFTNGMLEIYPDSSVSFFTYYNSFSIEKWSKLTNVYEVNLDLRIMGKFIINIYNSYFNNGKIKKNKIHTENKNNGFDDKVSIKISELNIYRGIIYFEIISLDEKVQFISGQYTGKIENKSLNEVDIKLVICTYRREKYINENLELLNEILSDDKYMIKNNLEVYVIDNGRTLNEKESSTIKVIHNKNLGGSGGFTRGIVEILQSENKFTNVLLMDDDVEILPESLERLYSFLKVIRNEYKDSIVSGSMLRIDKKWMLHETIGNFIGRGFDPLKYQLDLNNEYNIIFNESELVNNSGYSFAAWWFCCIPKSIIDKNNLPLPLFIKGDDVEYSIRNKNNLISLNGIGVWHESFEKKYAQANTFYYEIRNFLVITAVHFKNYNVFKAILFVIERYAREALRYRYNSTDLIIQAVEDFMKGVNFFLSVNDEENHKSISSKCYKFDSINEILKNERVQCNSIENEIKVSEDENNKSYLLKRIITINGYLIPRVCIKNKEMKIVPVNESKHINYYKNLSILNVLFEEETGFVTERNIARFMYDNIRLAGICFKLLFRYRSVRNDYKKNIKKLSTQEFWNNKFFDNGGQS